MNFKKFGAVFLSLSLISNFGYIQKARAIDPVSASILVTSGITAFGFVWSIIKDGMLIKLNRDEIKDLEKEIEKNKGFRSRLEATKMIKDVISGNSPIKIYGQEKAKRQCMSALSGCLENIYGKPSEVRGNVVYMIGDSGVGKTTMAKALANAFLKHSDKSCFFIDSSSVNNEQLLGEQLFRTTTKAVNLKPEKSWKNLFGVLDLKENAGGSYDIRVAAAILDHIFKYYDSVVILDEYDKMKVACIPPDAPEGYEDKSADEILKSIADRAEYTVEGNKVDCKKVLFFVTTNETKEQLYQNFGYKGSVGGGVQRLNVIEFESLDINCCKKIISDMVNNIRKNLTDSKGDFKLKNVTFSDQTLEDMAYYIYNNKVKQARAKFDLEQNIYALFNFEIEENIHKSFEIEYVPSEENQEVGSFTKQFLQDNVDSKLFQSPKSSMIDYANYCGNILDYLNSRGQILDFS